MDQNKVTLCWPNRVDQAAVTGGTWLSSLPLINVQDRILKKKARTSGVLGSSYGGGLNSQFEIALDKSRPTAVLALAAHNLSADATVRVRFYADYAKTTLLWDSGTVSAWPSFYLTEQLEWEDNNFWFGDNTIDPSADFTPLFTMFADAIYMSQLITVEILDPLNSAGYVEIGRAFVSNIWQPDTNMDYGVQFGYVNTTAVEEALDLTEYFDRKKQRRTMQFDLGNLTPDEAFGGIYSMQRDLGIDREFLVAYELAPSEQFYARTFLARNKQIDPLTQPYLDRNKVSIFAQEIL